MNYRPQTFSVYIVDSDIEKKMRLKQAATPVHLFRQTQLFNNLEEVLGRIENEDGGDIIFMSSRFPEKDIASFISRAKNTKRGQDSTFIMVLGAKDSESPKLPEYMLLGIDGFLFEPYSVDGLNDTAQLAIKIKGERREARERLAISVMVKDIIKQVDGLAISNKLGFKSSKIALRLASLGESLKNLPLDSLHTYFNVLSEEMINAPLPEKMAQIESYKGASTRVKKVIEKKIIAELEKDSID